MCTTRTIHAVRPFQKPHNRSAHHTMFTSSMTGAVSLLPRQLVLRPNAKYDMGPSTSSLPCAHLLDAGSAFDYMTDPDSSAFPLRGGQRIMVACGCSRLRGDLRRRRPGGHAASARARAGVVRTGCGSGPLPAAGKADRPLELLEPSSDALRPLRRRKLAEGQGGTDA